MKKLLLILGLILLNLSLVFAADGVPIVNLVAQDSAGQANVVVTALDRYDNAGIQWIKIYENADPTPVETKLCSGINPCVFSVTRDYPNTGAVTYQAEVKDNSNRDPVLSSIVTLNLAPVISNTQVTNIVSDGATFTWDTDELANSRIKYGIISGTYSNTKQDNNYVLNHSVALTGLSEGVTYYYVIESADPYGSVRTTTESTFVPRNINAPLISNVDSDVNIAVTPVQVTFTWDTDEVSDSNVRYGTVSGTYTASQYNPLTGLTHSVILTGLNDDTTYYYIVESTDIEIPSNTGRSLEGSFTIPDLTAPVLSNIRESDLTLTSIKINWNTNELSDSKVLYGTVTGTYTNTKEDSVDALTHSILLDNLVDGETYYYVVESADEHGNTARSAERSFTTGRVILEFTEPSDDEEYYVGENIEGEVRVENADVNDIEVDIDIVLYNEDENDEVSEINLEDKDIDSGKDEDFSFNFDLPYTLDEGDDYIIYAEVYVNGVRYREEIDVDISRKDHDVVISNVGVSTLKDSIEVSFEVTNRGKKTEQDVYIELDEYNLGLNLVSDRFELGAWDDSNDKVVKKFRFDRPESGMYTVEGNVFYGAYSTYAVKDFEIKDTQVQSRQSNVQLMEAQSYTQPSISEGSGLLSLSNITWGIVDFLLLVVVIYLLMWLI